MKPALIDTDILSLFLRKHPKVIARFQDYLTKYSQINISLITYYEILSGLKHRNAQKYLTSFVAFVSQNKILPLTQESVTISADYYAKLRVRGIPVDDIDLLIAGVATANNLIIVTHNQRHFGRIERLELQDWSED